MQRLRIAGTLLGLLLLTSGCATCRTPRCSKPCRAERPCRVEKPCRTGCDTNACCNDKCERGMLVPYRDACQSKVFSGNFLGRLGRWITYRPLCATTPCDCGDTPRCHPPLYTYFTPSKYNRCYEPVDCGGGACKPCRFGGIFHRNKCDTCEESCGPARDCWTLKISLPRISLSRGSGDCGTGCKDDTCGNKFMKLPRPISDRACENSSAGCSEGGCGSGRCGLGLRGRLFGGGGTCGGCGSCGLRGRFGNNINNKCCSSMPDVSNVDLNHLSILSPQALHDVKPGEMNTIPKAEALGPPKLATDESPGAKKE